MILEMDPVKCAEKKFLESGADFDGEGDQNPLAEERKWVNHST